MAGAIAAILTYFTIQVLDPILAQSGLFNSWASIESPPSGIERIIGVTGGGWSMKYEVWIEAHNGQIFSASVCGDQKCDPPEWKLTPKAPNGYIPDSRGADCKDLGDFPLNPSDQIVECVYVIDASIDLVPQIYLVQIADGSLRYFEMDINVLIVEGKIILTNLLIYFVMLLLVFRLTNYVVKQIQIKNASSHISG